MLNNVLGAKLRIVTGYPGSNEIMLAIERNEVQGVCGVGWSSVAPQRARLLDSGCTRLIAQLATKGHREMDRMGVPLAIDFAKTDEDRKVMDLIYSQLMFGRPYVAAARRRRPTASRRCARPSWTRSATRTSSPRPRKMKLDIDALSGDEVQAEVAKAFAMPRNIVERARQAMIYKSR